MLNVAFLVGRLGRHPEIRHTNAGAKVAELRLATTEWVKGAERTEWHSVIVWDEVLCDVLATRCRTGTLIAVMGTIRTRSYETKQKEKRVYTEIVLDKFGSKLQVLAGAVVNDRDPNAPLGNERHHPEPDLPPGFDDDTPPWA